MKQVVNLSLEEAWQNNPVVQLECNDVWLSALIDSGAGMPMYFGNRKTLERRLNGRVLDEQVSIRGISEGKAGVVHPYVVKENGQIYSLLNDVV